MKLLGELRALSSNPRIEEISDSIEVLSQAYSTDGTNCKWDTYGFTPKERDLVEALDVSRGRYVSRDNLIDRMYGQLSSDKIPDPKIIDVLVLKVRRKLVASGWTVGNSHGVGFRLEEGEAAKTWGMWHGVPLPRSHFQMATLLYAKLGELVRYDEFPAGLRDSGQGRSHWFRKRLAKTPFALETVFGVGMRMVVRA